MASTHVIGLDIGATGVRAAEVSFSGGAPGRGNATLERFGSQPLPPGAVRDGEVVEPDTVAGALRTMWAASRFSTKDVVLGIGNQRVVVRELDLPWMPAAQLKASLPYQVQDLLPMSGADALLDFWGVEEFDGPQGRMVHGMLVAAQRETVVNNVLAVEGAGLRPTMVDLNAFAVMRALTHGELAGKIVGFVDVGARITNVVVANAGLPKLIRIIPNGGQHITDAVAAAMQVSQPEAEALKRQVGLGANGQAAENPAAAEAIATAARALVEAVRNTFIYYASNHPGAGIDTLVLSGGGSQLPGLGQYMSSSTRLPTVLGNALKDFKVSRPSDGQYLAGLESLIAVPVGLAYGVAA